MVSIQIALRIVSDLVVTRDTTWMVMYQRGSVGMRPGAIDLALLDHSEYTAASGGSHDLRLLTLSPASGGAFPPCCCCRQWVIHELRSS